MAFNWTISYYNGSLPLDTFSDLDGSIDDASKNNVVWIDFEFGEYSYRLVGLDYYYIEQNNRPNGRSFFCMRGMVYDK